MHWFWVDLLEGTASVQEFTRVFLRLLVAAILGGLLGLERQRSHKKTGIRTHVLVAVGAAIFTIIADQASTQDGLSRVIQGVAAGVGFLGAGTIIKDGKKIRGLTTAASVWLTAAVGVAVGAGWILPSVITVTLAWIVLSTLAHPLERIGHQPHHKSHPSGHKHDDKSHKQDDKPNE